MSPGARPRRVEVTAHAKLNLGLAVGPARPDGYHDLVTVFQSISLADTLVAERARKGFTLRVRHENAAARGRLPTAAERVVPAGAENLVLRAARLAAARLGLPGGARFTLTKRIPAEAGLGGGSADAAAAFAALAALHGVRLARGVKLSLAAELGSDVPFAITGGTALGTGRGERLEKLALAAPFEVIVALPRWRVSTSRAYRQLDVMKYGLTGWNGILRFAASLGRKQVTPFSTVRLGNSFESVLGPRRRDFEMLCARLREAGLTDPRLTGSGSGVFGIVPKGASTREIVGRYSGTEPLFVARTRGTGMRIQLT